MILYFNFRESLVWNVILCFEENSKLKLDFIIVLMAISYEPEIH